jgi:ATP-dependent 26S proteasome regulatory subunit
MAPKGDSNVPEQDQSLLQKRHIPSEEGNHKDEQETNDGDRNKEEEEKDDSSSWNERLVECLRRLLEKTSKRMRMRMRILASTSSSGGGGGDCSDEYRRNILVGVGATVLVLLGYRFRRKLLSSLLLARSSLVLLPRRPDYYSATEAPLSLLYNAMNNSNSQRDKGKDKGSDKGRNGPSQSTGQIQRAWIGSSGIYYLLDGVWNQSVLPTATASSPGLQKDLLEQLSRSCPDVAVLPESLSSRAATPVLAALPFVYLAFLYRMMKNLSGGGRDGDSTVKTATDGSGSTSTTTFADVAGMDAVLPEVSEIVSYLRHPEKYDAVGARPPRGVLLHGPPGSGKTLLARAVAGEAAVDSFTACSASDFVEVYVGQGAARVRSLFRRARQEAKVNAKANKDRSFWWWKHPWTTSTRSSSSSQSPSTRKACAIIFIDELDALAKTRSSNSLNSNDEREQTLNQLLTEMDGFVEQDSNSDVTVIVMAASNRADVLDPAMLRRMDRQIHVGYPDCAGRCAILQVHARKIQCRQLTTVDWTHLATVSKNFSGADLRNAVNEAALLAVREGCAAVQQNHLEHAVRRIRQMKNNLNSTNTESIPVMDFR